MVTYFNETFQGLGPRQLNACVGKNGSQDLHKYAMGFSEIFLKSIEQTILDPYDPPVDTAVYPLCFLARHTIELYLKLFIFISDQILWKKNMINDVQIDSMHSIKLLWEKVCEKSNKADRRLGLYLHQFEEYLIDFWEIDDTGESFRYPYDIKYNLSLEGVSLINMKILRDRVTVLFDMFKETAWIYQAVRHEYSYGTFTNELSRTDLKYISKQLPRYGYWRTSLFLEKKQEIKNKFNLSNRKFQLP